MFGQKDLEFIGFFFIGLLILAPFGVWKIIELIIWAFKHIKIVW